MMNYILTNHLRERYIERCRQEKLDLSNRENWSLVSQELHRLLRESEEVKHYLNDTDLMMYLYQRYGFDRHFSIRQNSKILFVVIHEKSGDEVTTKQILPRNVVVTCFLNDLITEIRTKSPRKISRQVSRNAHRRPRR